MNWKRLFNCWKLIKTCMLCLTALSLCFMIHQNAEAATAGISEQISAGKSCQSYDLDGDGKKDTISVKTAKSTGGYASAYLYINGKCLYVLKQLSPYSDDYSDCACMVIITLKNGKCFIVLSGDNISTSKDVVLQFKNGTVKEIAVFYNIMSKFAGNTYLPLYSDTGIVVKGNTVYFKVSSMNWTLGGAYFQFKYKYSGGTLKRVVSYGKISEGFGTYTAAKKFTVYKSIGNKNKAFTVKKGESVQIQSFRLKGGKLWLCVKNSSGKTGWIKGLTKAGTSGRSTLFSNGWYAS